MSLEGQVGVITGASYLIFLVRDDTAGRRDAVRLTVASSRAVIQVDPDVLAHVRALVEARSAQTRSTFRAREWNHTKAFPPKNGARLHCIFSQAAGIAVNLKAIQWQAWMRYAPALRATRGFRSRIFYPTPVSGKYLTPMVSIFETECTAQSRPSGAF